jgi:LemA protein
MFDPNFSERLLHNVFGRHLVFEVLQSESENVIRKKIDCFVVLSDCHLTQVQEYDRQVTEKLQLNRFFTNELMRFPATTLEFLTNPKRQLANISLISTELKFIEMVGILITVGVIVLLVFYLISLNNKLVALNNNRENAFADIDVQLKQRYDLIPQLMGAVKGYMDHEKEVLTRVTEARSRCMSANSINDKISANNELGAAMGAFNIQVEAYPDLKANQNFMHLQQEISDVENKLAAVRRFFNSATRELNNAIEQFPSNLVANFRKMTVQPMFDLGSEQRVVMDKAPEVKF